MMIFLFSFVFYEISLSLFGRFLEHSSRNKVPFPCSKCWLAVSDLTHSLRWTLTYWWCQVESSKMPTNFFKSFLFVTTHKVCRRRIEKIKKGQRLASTWVGKNSSNPLDGTIYFWTCVQSCAMHMPLNPWLIPLTTPLSASPDRNSLSQLSLSLLSAVPPLLWAADPSQSSEHHLFLDMCPVMCNAHAP